MSRPDMTPPDDETLVAYADGRLDSERAAEVTRYLETNPEMARTVELLRLSGELAEEAFNEAMEKPSSTALADMILSYTPEKPDNVVPFKRPVAKQSSTPATARWAIAASLALVICGALAVSVLLESDQRADEIAKGPVPSGSALATLLERTTAGDAVRDNDREITVMATFRDKESRPCREFESHGQTPEMHIGVACRSPGGAWTVEGVVRIANAEGTGTTFSPASGEQLPEIEALLTALGAGPALTPDEENRFLASGWQPPK